MKKAILFDLDNTLIDRQKAAYYLYTDMIKHFFPKIDDLFLIECAVQTLINFDAFGHGNKYEAFSRIGKMLDKEINSEEMFKYWVNNIGDYTLVFDGAEEVCAELKKKYKIGIVTNGAKDSQGAKLKKVSFLNIFDSVVISGELNVHKPDAKPYLKCCHDLDVKPSECIFVGDTFHTDLLGAYNLGMDIIWICQDRTRTGNNKVKRISDIKELLNIL